MTARIHVRSVGPVAEEVLAGSRGLRAIALFRRSFYLEDDAGRLACLVRNDLEPGPINATATDWPDDVRTLLTRDEPFRRTTKDRLAAAGGKLDIDLAARHAWTPPAPPPTDSRNIAAGLDALGRLLPERIPENSLAGLLTDDADKAAATGGPFEKALFAQAADCVRELRNWLANPSRRPERAVAGLLGFGPGLTPAGDDALGGALVALHARGEKEAALALARAIENAGRERTTKIARAHLRAAATGMGAEALHLAVNGIMAGGRELPAALDRLGRVGHTSGWDSLLGAHLVLSNSLRQYETK